MTALSTRTLSSGGSAALLSLIALLVRSRRDIGSPWSGVNAVSHWIHGRPALRTNRLSGRYTLPGFFIHSASSLLWGGLHRLVLAASPRPSVPAIAASAAAVTAVAMVTDLCLVPERLTPGFERNLKPHSVALVYVAFACGLALAAAWDRGNGSSRKQRHFPF